MHHKLIPAAGAVIVFALALAGCASSTPSATDSDAAAGSLADCDISLIPKSTDNPFFASIRVGADEAAAELGGKPVDFVGTAQADVQGQIQRVQNATLHKACAINIAALDPDATAPALTQALDQDTKVVAFDADVQPDARTLFINQADATALGVAMLDILAKDMNYTGTFAILSAQSTAQNQNSWIAAVEEELTKPDYADMTLVKTVYGDDDSKKSYDAAVSLMQGYPDLGGILSPEPAGLEASVKARDDLGTNPDLVLTGLGWPPSDASLLKDGKVSAFVLWSPVDLGYLTYHATAALVSGQITGAEGDTFDAGRLGERTVGANGVVVLGDPAVYTADNVDAALDDFRTE
ncbi:substrate-binding domain-containing protein [Herbiconiux daphne]|uniref:Substrate-binding domain-containing protein n=1 Tax=Herbiconiux daphne TaxID=2970914 RepID=A0ABT2H508_9MICO|nr:substrate-binding domain-containing protein [Herbiconiux daphne]MCS5735013.1 substrate-binding domain-containing protein [Herbiconiux daphne]